MNGIYKKEKETLSNITTNNTFLELALRTDFKESIKANRLRIAMKPLLFFRLNVRSQLTSASAYFNTNLKTA